MDELTSKIERLRVRYKNEQTMPPGDVMSLFEELRAQTTARMDGLGSMLEALNGRIDQLEKTAPGYRERG